MRFVISKQYVHIAFVCTWIYKIFLNLYAVEKSPGSQRPSWHCSSEDLLEAHSSPPEQVLVLVLVQLAPQPDHSLHPKDVKR